MKKEFTKKMYKYNNRGWSERCPNCRKRIILKDKIKKIVKCSKCFHFILFIRGRSYEEVLDLLKPEEGRFFEYKIIENDYDDFLLKGVFHIKESQFNTFKSKSKKAGLALEKFLGIGNKKILTPEEQNILYKLKAESVFKITKKIGETVEYLEAKIECVKLLKILDY